MSGTECIVGTVVWMIVGSLGPGPAWSPLQDYRDWNNEDTPVFYLETHEELYEVVKDAGVVVGAPEFHKEWYWRKNWRGEDAKFFRKVRRTPFILPPAIHFLLVTGDVEDGKGLKSPSLGIIEKGFEAWICVW